MQFWASLRQHLAFTRREMLAIAFLTAALLVGQAVRWSRAQDPQEAPATRYAALDSEFAARTHGDDAPTTAAPDSSRRLPPRPRLAPGSVNINTATLDQLIELPGIGPVTAQKILAFRSENGPFESAEDLLEVNGIGPKKLARIRAYLRVD